MQQRVARRLVATTTVLWALLASAFGGLLALEFLFKSDLSCPVGTSGSEFGTTYLSFMPPGVACEYDKSQRPPDGGRDEPPGTRTVALAGLGATGIGVIAGRQAYHRRFPDERPRRRRFQDVLIRAE